MLGQRRLEPEILDHAAPADAAASLRDLVRINKYLGGHRVLRQMLGQVLESKTQPFTMLDVGAASGDMAQVASSGYPNAKVTSLDYKLNHLSSAPMPKIQADAFRLPFPHRSFDFVHCSLFLHHFDDEAVVDLLRSFGSICRSAVLVSDLERHPLAYWFLPATRRLFGWDPITLHDGPISVAAAFKPLELESLAKRAGLRSATVRAHRPAFRLSLIAKPQDAIFAS